MHGEAALVRDGEEFLVNEFTTLSQSSPAVAATATGGFVVVWDGPQDDDSMTRGIIGRGFDSRGVPTMSEFQVNTSDQYDTRAEGGASLGMEPGGGFVVAWEGRYGQDTSDSGIYAQRLDLSYQKVGGEFRVNSYILYEQRRPKVACDVDGAFAIVWEDTGYLDISPRGSFLTVYAPDGAPRRSELQVTTTADTQLPDVAATKPGEFVVVATSDDGGDSGRDIIAQRFNFNGRKIGTPVQVNTFTTGAQVAPALAAYPDGSFIVVWRSDGQDGSGDGVFARRFDWRGDDLGPEFQVNSYTTGDQMSPEVAIGENDTVVVVWTNRSQDEKEDDVYARQIIGNQPAESPEMRVNSTVVGDQGARGRGIDIAAYANGRRFIVTWHDLSGKDGSFGGVFGQKLCVEQAAPTCGDVTCAGDPDVQISVTDAVAILEAAVGLRPSCARCVCDVDSSGTIAAADALRVLQRAVGTGDSLPCPATCAATVTRASVKFE